MFSKFINLWRDYGFEIVAILCVIALIVFAIMRIGNTGSWNSKYFDPFTLSRRPIQGTVRDLFDQSSSSNKPTDSKGEGECRRVLERLLSKRFPKTRPDFLRNPVTGGKFNMELDMYCRELRLACEYNGQQHYKYVPYFHRNKEAFRNQGYRDELKRRMCRENGVHLIEVPYTIKLRDIEHFLYTKLRNIGLL
jgi:hypothetical protein